MIFSLVDKIKCIADYLPNGKAWLAKRITTTNTYKFLKALTYRFQTLDYDLEKLKQELDPATTSDLISEWEREVGIPDECFPVANNLIDRRKNVLLKIAALGVQTDPDFEALALKLGATCICWRDGVNKFRIYFDLPIAWSPYVFPIPFPYPFGLSYGNIIECLFTKLIPANCEPVFRYIL
jgi:uncharacterized protein YmfQ (DUF2313 family)